jgi:hypothetical protein
MEITTPLPDVLFGTQLSKFQLLRSLLQNYTMAAGYARIGDIRDIGCNASSNPKPSALISLRETAGYYTSK